MAETIDIDRMIGICIAAGFGLYPALPSNGSTAGGRASLLIPACLLTLFFTAHAELQPALRN